MPSVAIQYQAGLMDEQERIQNMAAESPDMSYMRSAVGVIRENMVSSDPLNTSFLMKLFAATQNEGLKGEAIVQKAK
jgi:hypothetical protein